MRRMRGAVDVCNDVFIDASASVTFIINYYYLWNREGFIKS